MRPGAARTRKRARRDGRPLGGAHASCARRRQRAAARGGAAGAIPTPTRCRPESSLAAGSKWRSRRRTTSTARPARIRSARSSAISSSTRMPRRKSGIGLSLRGQAYWRPTPSKNADLLVRISSSADLYTEKRFDDIVLQAEAGPQLTLRRRPAGDLGDRRAPLVRDGKLFEFVRRQRQLPAPARQARPAAARRLGDPLGQRCRTTCRTPTRYSLAAVGSTARSPRASAAALQLSGSREVSRRSGLFDRPGRHLDLPVPRPRPDHRGAQPGVPPARGGRAAVHLSRAAQGRPLLGERSRAPSARSRSARSRRCCGCRYERNISTIEIYDFRRLRRRDRGQRGVLRLSRQSPVQVRNASRTQVAQPETARDPIVRGRQPAPENCC